MFQSKACRLRARRLIYTGHMYSVADELRTETLKRVKELSPEERVSLAFELGDFDLALYCTYHGLDPGVALEKLRLLRQSGRRISAPTRIPR